MKRLSLLILLWISILPLIAQINLVYTGSVINITSGAPIPYHLVRIQSDSNAGTSNFFYDSTYTDMNGHFYDTVHLSPQMPVSGHASLIVEDCQNYFNFWSSYYGPNSYIIQHEFHICNNDSSALCNADFSYQQYPLVVYLTNLSSGGSFTSHWNFGDGTNSQEQNPLHIYQQPGLYNITLAIQSNTGCSDSITKPIFVSDSTNIPCQAAFTYQPDSINPQTIHFWDQSVGNPGIDTWYWDFDDYLSGLNNTSILQNPVHAFASVGYHEVYLSITGPNGCSNHINQWITIYSGECHAEFYTHSDSLTPEIIHFYDQSTPANNIYSWLWNFGDPASGPISNTSTLQYPTHTFSSNGNFMVCLTIHGADSCFSTYCDTVVIGSTAGCQAYYTYYADSLNVPPQLSYHFIDQSQGNPYHWQWSFGDGTDSDQENPQHIFPQSGTYHVCLTITGYNCQDSYCHDITIPNAGNCYAHFDYNHQSLTGYFHGFINDSQTGTFYWNFGDGSNGQGANETHIFAMAGMYTVTLFATDNNNCTATYTSAIFAGDSAHYYQLYGQIIAGNMPLQTGMAMIFSSDTLPNYNPFISVVQVDSLGTYYFSMVPAGSYYIYAIPFLPTGFIPTYYGNVVFWENATVVSTAQLNNPYNIHLVSADSIFSGPGVINGIINTTGLKTTIVDKVTMLLMNAQGKSISYGTVSTSGAFDFSTLAYGTYFLKAEIAGVNSDLVKVVLSADNPQANVTLSFTGTHILGVNDIKPVLTAGVIYPNPVSGDAHVQITVPERMNISIIVYNITGQAVIDNHVQVSGTTTLTLPCSGLPSGIYNLTLVSDNGFRLNRKLVVTR